MWPRPPAKSIRHRLHLNLGRALELAGNPSLVLQTDMPVAAAASEPTADSTKDDPADDGDNGTTDKRPANDNGQPAADGKHSAANETESNDGPEDASPEPSIRRGADGFPDTLSVSAWARDPDLAATTVAGELFDRLRNEYAHVIVAAPPVLTTITASIVSESADAVLLILALGTTRRRDLAHAADNLRATGAPLTGAVLSETKPAPVSASAQLSGPSRDPDAANVVRRAYHVLFAVAGVLVLVALGVMALRRLGRSCRFLQRAR